MPILSGGPLYRDKTNTIEDYPSSLGETFAAGFDRAVDTGLSELAGGALRIARGDIGGIQEIGRPFGVDAAAEVDPSSRVYAADARKRAEASGVKLVISDEAYFSPGELDTVIALKKRERAQLQTLGRRPQTWGGFAAEMGGGLAGSMTDPVQVAASFIPVVGQARYARFLAGASGMGERAAIRAGVGAVEGLAGAALLEPLIYSRAQSIGLEYTSTDSFMNLAFGTVMGGGLHVAGGAIGDVLSPARRAASVAPEMQSRAALHEAVTALDAGRALDVEPVFSAYHGSPYSFDRFKSDAIGSGDGASSFGRGLYFAEQRDLAAEYARDLGLTIDLNGRPLARAGKLVEGGASTGNDYADRYLLKASGDVDIALERLAEDFRGTVGGSADYFAIKNALISARDGISTKQNGRVYRVNIKAAEESLYDWEKPLGEQSPVVKDAIDRVARDPRWALDKVRDDMTGAQFSRFLQNPEVTAELRRLGVIGIRYLDPGSRQAGKTARNYVIFDDKVVSIVAKEPAVMPETYDPVTGYEPPEMERVRIEADEAAMAATDDIDGEIEALGEMVAMAEKRGPMTDFDRSALDLADAFETNARRTADSYRAAAACISGVA